MNITLADVESDTTLQAISLPCTKTKKERKFVINGEYLKIVKAYQQLRPSDVTTNRFFLNYQNGKCTKQVIGKNKIGGMPKQIATYLNLPNPELYTGHCFRRTSATLLADSGANLTTIKRHGGWKSDQVAEGYIEESIQNKYNITSKLTSGIKISPQNEPQPSTSRDMSNEYQHLDNENMMERNVEILPESPTYTELSATQNSQIQSTSTTSTRVNIPRTTIIYNITNNSNCTFSFK